VADIAIAAEGISKRFVKHHARATSLKERLVNRRETSEDFWAVRDLTLDVYRGETVGLIGANGSGKSTSLRLLAGILRPTSGSVTVRGRIASLLEVGAGFNGELSGRDNVYLNASLLGLSRREVDVLFDQIVDFSEIGEYIDNQVKHYSSGMYVRLGFAVAVHVDPDILLVDEVLAVGDEAFAAKCLDKIEEFQAEGRTILFVTHALDLVERICSRAVVLDHGVTRYIGDPAFAAGTLRGILGTKPPPEPTEEMIGGIVVRSVTVSEAPESEPKSAFIGGETFNLRVEVEVLEGKPVYSGQVTAVVMGAGDIPIWVMGEDGRGVVPASPGRYLVDFEVPELPPLLGSFVLAVGVIDPETGTPLTARRFDDCFSLKGGQSHGLVDVAYKATTQQVALRPAKAFDEVTRD
jgi:ABC-2 type transport system ATP-binding protein